MARHYSNIRWKVQVDKICRKLQEFTYVDVKNELKRKTRPKMVKGRLHGRNNVGFLLPTDRQLQAYLMRADYCVEIFEPQKHIPAKYRFVPPTASTSNTISGDKGST